jgi:bifunctional N-acetylglucosamine-1-phosphate-uridyltransferase/glucosamine-1-phosphate-acetyltransferase GlmU-like protein
VFESNFHPSLDIDASCIIPMAGAGSRFSEFGFKTPKPLIQVDDKNMVTKAVSCLPKCSDITYLVRSEMLSEQLNTELKSLNKQTQIIKVDELTEGQACTCALAVDSLPEDKALFIAPCDNGMIWNQNTYEELLQDSSIDLICWTFSKHLAISQKPTAWGYVSTDEHNNVKDVSVKKPFTTEPYNEHCIIGTFWFKSAKLFKNIYHELIKRNIRVNNEFYVDSMVGLAQNLNYNVKVFNVDRYISWGKPEDLFEYRKWIKIMELLK